MAKNKEKQYIYIVQSSKETVPSLKERGLSQKDVLQKAQKKRNNDEFYTKYEDVEKELSMYNKNIWKNKTVFCNCDDPVGDDEMHTSAFSLYFIQNFNVLGIKKLICTHFGDNGDLFNEEPRGKPRGIFVGEEIYYTDGVCTPPSNQGTKGYVFTKDGFREFKEFPKGYTGSFDHLLDRKSVV